MSATRSGVIPRGAMAASVAGVLIVGLGACSDVRNALGLGKTSPDEFAVVRHAALAVPPNFDLRPPEPGAPRPQARSPRQEARAALLGQGSGSATAGPAAVPGGRTPGERSILKQSGSAEVPVNIREVVRIEAAALGIQDRSFTDSLLFWTGSDDEGEVLDAAAEAERLRRQKEGGAAPAGGSGVVIKRKEGGLFGSLF